MKLQKGNALVLLLGGLAIILVVVLIYFYLQSQKTTPAVSPPVSQSPTTPPPVPVISPPVASESANPNANTYVSQKLGVSFNYSNQLFNDTEKVTVREVGTKIYVYSSSAADYTTGQWVEVFSKDKSDSLAQAIKKTILNGYSEADCMVGSAQKYTSSYPASFETADIEVPTSPDDDLSTLAPKWAKCHEPYVTENGISYFLMDSNHPEKFVYFSIGQYAINSGFPNKSWQETFKFL